MLRRRTVPALLLAGMVLLTGCSADPTAAPADGASTTNRITIVADTYPTAYAAEQIGGDRVDVILLTQPGVEPHDLELSADQVRQIADADLVAYIPGLVPAVQDAAEQEAADRSVAVTSGITLRPGDPHVWLDPRNMALMGTAIADALETHGLGSSWDTGDLTSAMTALDGEFRTTLAPCKVRTLVVSHAAFGYLADAYDFRQEPIAGLSPEAEPSPARMAELTRLIEAEGVTTIYFEPLASPESAEAIAAETGTRTATLDPIEGSTGGRSYDELMGDNLAALTTGQECA